MHILLHFCCKLFKMNLNGIICCWMVFLPDMVLGQIYIPEYLLDTIHPEIYAWNIGISYMQVWKHAISWHGAFILLCQWVFHLVDNWSSVHLMPQCCTSRSWVSGFPYCCRLKELCFEVTPLCSVDLRSSSILCDNSALRLAFESSLNWLLFYPCWSDFCFKGKLSSSKV